MRRLGVLLAALCCLCASDAHARGLFGLQAGGSFGPDQFVVGLHMGFSVGQRITVVPSVDAGFGDEAFTLAVNGDAHYAIMRESRLRPYVGAGLTWYDINPDGDGESSSEVGGTAIAGIHVSSKLFLEGKVGLGDVPDFKLMAGFTP